VKKIVEKTERNEEDESKIVHLRAAETEQN
jgi:hypothetical protein